mmetsp:Transcript_13103/g.40721  ORF Transcript_13103/g.40721 Transcript_13103/m.40721 type:complete len:310 (-) Transcript_13103:1610-2539(-)
MMTSNDSVVTMTIDGGEKYRVVRRVARATSVVMPNVSIFFVIVITFIDVVGGVVAARSLWRHGHRHRHEAKARVEGRRGRQRRVAPTAAAASRDVDHSGLAASRPAPFADDSIRGLLLRFCTQLPHRRRCIVTVARDVLQQLPRRGVVRVVARQHREQARVGAPRGAGDDEKRAFEQEVACSARSRQVNRLKAANGVAQRTGGAALGVRSKQSVHQALRRTDDLGHCSLVGGEHHLDVGRDGADTTHARGERKEHRAPREHIGHHEQICPNPEGQRDAGARDLRQRQVLPADHFVEHLEVEVRLVRHLG